MMITTNTNLKNLVGCKIVFKVMGVRYIGRVLSYDKFGNMWVESAQVSTRLISTGAVISIFSGEWRPGCLVGC